MDYVAGIREGFKLSKSLSLRLVRTAFDTLGRNVVEPPGHSGWRPEAPDNGLANISQFLPPELFESGEQPG
jgi:hypothetical protein